MSSLKGSSSSLEETCLSDQKSRSVNREDTFLLQESTVKNFQDHIQTEQTYSYKNIVDSEFSPNTDNFYSDQQFSIASKLSPIGVQKTNW